MRVCRPAVAVTSANVTSALADARFGGDSHSANIRTGGRTIRVSDPSANPTSSKTPSPSDSECSGPENAGRLPEVGSSIRILVRHRAHVEDVEEVQKHFEPVFRDADELRHAEVHRLQGRESPGAAGFRKDRNRPLVQLVP